MTLNGIRRNTVIDLYNKYSRKRMRRKIKMIIAFYKLEQIIKIWMESIKTDKEVWYKTVGSRTEDGWAQTYELSPPKEVHTSDDTARFVFIHAITDSTIKNAKEFRICLDSIDNPVFVISNISTS